MSLITFGATPGWSSLHADAEATGQPRPLPPPGPNIITDPQWAHLRSAFAFPEQVETLALRPYLELLLRSYDEERKHRDFEHLRREADDAIKWLSRASNLRKKMKFAISTEAKARLAFMARKLNEEAGREIIQPDEIERAKRLTLRIQLCALMCRAVATRPRPLPSLGVHLYSSLFRLWASELGRKATRWARDNGAASKFVKFVTLLLRWSGEPLPADDAHAYKAVRSRLDLAMKEHPREFEWEREHAAPASAPASARAFGECFRVKLRRRTLKAGFSRRRR